MTDENKIDITANLEAIIDYSVDSVATNICEALTPAVKALQAENERLKSIVIGADFLIKKTIFREKVV